MGSSAPHSIGRRDALAAGQSRLFAQPDDDRDGARRPVGVRRVDADLDADGPALADADFAPGGGKLVGVNIDYSFKLQVERGTGAVAIVPMPTSSPRGRWTAIN